MESAAISPSWVGSRYARKPTAQPFYTAPQTSPESILEIKAPVQGLRLRKCASQAGSGKWMLGVLGSIVDGLQGLHGLHCLHGLHGHMAYVAYLSHVRAVTAEQPCMLMTVQTYG